jgi:dUTP pyrophosphatase
MKIYIYANNSEMNAMLVEQLNNHRWTDSGFDIPLYKSTNVNQQEDIYTFKLGVHVAATDDAGRTVPCILLARSSIYKTPFRLCNSIGLIDQGYRGELMAKTDVLDSRDAAKGDRLFQIVPHNFLTWTAIEIVTSLEDLPKAPDNRGSGGFGSTG